MQFPPLAPTKSAALKALHETHSLNKKHERGNPWTKTISSSSCPTVFLKTKRSKDYSFSSVRKPKGMNLFFDLAFSGLFFRIGAFWGRLRGKPFRSQPKGMIPGNRNRNVLIFVFSSKISLSKNSNFQEEALHTPVWTKCGLCCVALLQMLLHCGRCAVRTLNAAVYVLCCMAVV